MLSRALQRMRAGLERTRRTLATNLGDLLAGGRPVDDDLLEDLEVALLEADLGLTATRAVVDAIRRERFGQPVRGLADLRPVALRCLEDLLEDPPEDPPVPAGVPKVTLVVGVNGGGKTTTAGKLAWLAGQEGKRGILCAADTFRAAAADQLRVWAERSGADLVRHQDGADPSAVVYDALAAAEARRADFVIIDTAGRLHTKIPLMEELGKIHRVTSRRLPGAPHAVLLVVDATTGQNGIAQARAFTGAAPVSGLVLTKLDGTARGGVALAIHRDLKVPIRYLGTGERPEDLVPFSRGAFLEGLFPS